MAQMPADSRATHPSPNIRYLLAPIDTPELREVLWESSVLLKNTT